MDENKPKVGIGVIVFKEGKILLHQRKGSHGAGEWSFPGGHLEYEETFEECAKRETMEEAGITIKNIRFQYLRNVLEYLPKHYVHISMMAEYESGEPKNMEPEKGTDWQWFEVEKLPSPLFKTIPLAIESLKTGAYYYNV